MHQVCYDGWLLFRDWESMVNRLKTFWQYCLPHHLFSRLVGCLANSTCPKLKRFLIRAAIKRFDINVAEASPNDPEQYRSFNEFFTRELQPGTRPIAAESDSIVSPADGSICRVGSLCDQPDLIAKGHHFTLEQLLGGASSYSEALIGGQTVTIYLAPKDYHRVHMPISGQLLRMTYIPGRLFSVNTLTTNSVTGLFARNERIACFFKTEIGTVAVILVGAMLVASIKTVWASTVVPCRDNVIKTWDYSQDSMQFAKGQEIGQFSFGSTAIALFPKDSIVLEASLQADDSIKMGQIIGKQR